MDNKTIYVLQQSGYAVNTNNPQKVSVKDDAFKCPQKNCDGIVPITYWVDESGKHPNFGLRCTKCGCSYFILK